jgi:hypothetical protein
MSGRGSGADVYSNTALAGTAMLAKTGKCSLSGFHFFNTSSTAAAYVQFFDAAAAASVTLATTTPKMSFGIPASGGATKSIPSRIQFTSGMVIAATTTATGSSSAAAVVVIEIGD